MGPVKGGSVLAHVANNNAERDGATSIVQKYRLKLDWWECFVGRADMFMRDGLHLSCRVQQWLRTNSQQKSTVT